MPLLPLRKLPDRPNASVATQWLEHIETALAEESVDRSDLCRQILCDIVYPQFSSSWETAVADTKLPAGTRLALAGLDPRNITLEPEYYADCDDVKFQRVKPLLWLWYSFDRTTLGAQNVDLG